MNDFSQPLVKPNTDDATKPVVLTVAFPYAPVGPKAVGGAEVMCSQLEAALESCGFRSVVVAHADSLPSGRLYPTAVPAETITDQLRKEVEASQQRSIDRALAENPVALVHMHGLDFHRYRIPEEVPVLVTLHLPPSWYPESIWSLPGNYHFVCVSENQRGACPEWARDRVAVVANGVALPDASRLRSGGRYALMLARICPEKNLHTGLDAARLANMPAVLGGAVFPYAVHERYFAEEIEPRLTARGSGHEQRSSEGESHGTARFLGPVSGAEKERLLSRAACLLLPSLAPETSSLVAMEALAYGTPVIAMAVGAVPEIVEDGRTGFLVSPGEHAVREMAAAIRRVAELDRNVCRAAAEERFPFSLTLDAYCELYKALCRPAAARQLPESEPTEAQEPHLGLEVAEVPKRELRIQEIASGEVLQELASEWGELWAKDRAATPFQHPAWLLPWWHQFGPDGELHALALRDATSGSLNGLLPLYVYRQPQIGERKLLLLGAGTTDYLDGIWEGADARYADQALAYVRQELHGWDVASLHQLRENSVLTAVARSSAWQPGNAEPTSSIHLSEPLPAKVRTNVRRYRRRAKERGALRCSVASSAEEALCHFDLLVKLHTERWQRRGEPGVLSDPRVLAHHRTSIPLMLAEGLLCLVHLQLGDETMGVLYGLLDGPHVRERRLYLYLIGFDAKFAVLSPGSLLLHEAWQYAHDHGLAKLDLLRGGEEYKQLWGARAEPTYFMQVDHADNGSSVPGLDQLRAIGKS